MVPADRRAGRAEGEAAGASDAALDRQPERPHPAVRERTVELGDGAERRGSAGARTEADRRQLQPRPAGGVGLELGDAAHRHPGARLAQGHPPVRKSAAAHHDIAVDAQRVGRPVISDSGAAKDPRARSSRTGDVRVRHPCGTAAGEVHHPDSTLDVEIARGAGDRARDRASDRADGGSGGRRQRLGHSGKHRRIERGAVRREVADQRESPGAKAELVAAVEPRSVGVDRREA